MDRGSKGEREGGKEGGKKQGKRERKFGMWVGIKLLPSPYPLIGSSGSLYACVYIPLLCSIFIFFIFLIRAFPALFLSAILSSVFLRFFFLVK